MSERSQSAASRVELLQSVEGMKENMTNIQERSGGYFVVNLMLIGLIAKLREYRGENVYPLLEQEYKDARALYENLLSSDSHNGNGQQEVTS